MRRPGTGLTLPPAFDAYPNVGPVGAAPFGPPVNVLDVGGAANTAPNLTPGLPPNAVELVAHKAYLTLDASSTIAITSASNAVAVELDP